MPSFPLAFRCKSLIDGRRILGVMQEAHGLTRDSATTETELFLDTADGCIRSAGGSLALSGDGAAAWLAWRTREGELLHRVQVPSAPSCARELPPGAFHEELVRTIGARRLFGVARLDSRRVTLAAKDEDLKTVARVTLEHGSCSDPRQPELVRRVSATLQVLPVRGYSAEARRLSSLLSSFPDLAREEPSRLARALESLGAPASEQGPAPDRRIDPGERADRATVRVLAGLYADLVRVEDAVRRDADPEALHDYRVALRRTRAVLGQMKAVLPSGVAKRFRDEFAWLARATGLLRDLDVLLAQLPGYRAGLAEPDRAGLEPVLRLVGEQRSHAREALVAAHASERCATLLESWRSFLAAPDLVEPAPAAISTLAARRTRRALHEVRTRGRSIDESSSGEDLHRLRIAAKKLRYLLELFGDALPAREAGSLVRLLKKLQDVLGRINDLRVQRGALSRLDEELASSGLVAPATERAIESVVASLGRELRRERRRFERRFERFDGSKAAERFERITDAAAQREA